MREWAMEHGATHYTHWFQPMTGLTAEKHDSFMMPTAEGTAVAEFGGKELVRGEPDASSFPSGGIRTTSRLAVIRRGTRPARLSFSTTPMAPPCASQPRSVPGPAKPLTRRPLCSARWKRFPRRHCALLQLFGSEASRVYATAGPEQEYFLIDKNSDLATTNLINAGRTLFGTEPPKGQEMEACFWAPYRNAFWLACWRPRPSCISWACPSRPTTTRFHRHSTSWR